MSVEELDLTTANAKSIAAYRSQRNEDVKRVLLRQPEEEDAPDLSEFITLITDVNVFPNLVDVTLSYVPLNEDLFNLLCNAIASRTLDCLWRKVSLVRCELNVLQMRQFFKSINGNPRIELINVTGNKCDEESVKLLMRACTNPESQINALYLNACHLTPACLQDIVNHLHNSKFQIKSLHLSNNPSIFTDKEVLDKLFDHLILPTVPLTELTLAGGNMTQTFWSRYLPFVRGVKHLNLSYNKLDDDAFILLCLTLSTCPCLLRLDLSYNAFYSQQCAAVEQLLTGNKSLHFLSLAGHQFDQSVLTSLQHALQVNPTLLTLDLSDCYLSPEEMKELAPIYQHNSTVTLLLKKNLLPFEMMRDSRAYYISLDPALYVPLAPQFQYEAHDKATEWREFMVKQVDMSVSTQPGAENLPLTPDAPAQHAYLLPLVEKSSYYYSTQDMEKIIEDAHKAHSNQSIHIDIMLGRREGLLLGSVQIHGLTTYETIRPRVVKLIKEYARSGGEEAMADYKEFLFLDPNALPVPKEELYRRKVWSDVWSQDPPVVAIRPASWLSLTGEEGVGEGTDEQGETY